MRPWLPLSLAGCASLQALPPDAPCVEAGYAISRRTFECTGDAELANARFERYRREFECIDLPKWSVDTGEVTKFLEAEGSGAALSPPRDWVRSIVQIPLVALHASRPIRSVLIGLERA